MARFSAPAVPVSGDRRGTTSCSSTSASSVAHLLQRLDAAAPMPAAGVDVGADHRAPLATSCVAARRARSAVVADRHRWPCARPRDDRPGQVAGGVGDPAGGERLVEVGMGLGQCGQRERAGRSIVCDAGRPAAVPAGATSLIIDPSTAMSTAVPSGEAGVDDQQVRAGASQGDSEAAPGHSNRANPDLYSRGKAVTSIGRPHGGADHVGQRGERRRCVRAEGMPGQRDIESGRGEPGQPVDDVVDGSGDGKGVDHLVGHEVGGLGRATIAHCRADGRDVVGIGTGLVDHDTLHPPQVVGEHGAHRVARPCGRSASTLISTLEATVISSRSRPARPAPTASSALVPSARSRGSRGPRVARHRRARRWPPSAWH